MTIIRKVYLIGAGLLVFLGVGAPIEAQVVCGSCIRTIRDVVETEPGVFEGDLLHRFPNGGDQCNWSVPGRHSWCVRCGGTSFCHTGWWSGNCHIACGPTGGMVAALTEIREALETDDMAVVATAVLRERSGVVVEFISEAGRIDLFLPCSPDRPFHTIPVLPGMRERLGAQLA